MTVAAIYARYSSDSQREESIEIQVEQCTDFIEKHGWDVGEIYADYALTGKTDDRPAFQRCMSDGLAGNYDVLVFYKRDRFARRVIDSRKYKEALQEKGIRIFSVREGESKATPDGFLHEIMDEAFAEYYSLNLAVLIRDGIEENARNCKASGVRIFGFDVDETDHFIPHERDAAGALLMFETYAKTDNANITSRVLNEHGYRTIRGNEWTPKVVLRCLHKDAYIGVYRYAGHVVKGGMPALVPEELFYRVQEMLENKSKRKRKRMDNDYLLTTKLYCLRCGHTMQGQSGTSKTGRKYTYYACLGEDGCGLRVPSKKVETAVLDAVKTAISDEDSVNAIVEAMMELAASTPNNAELYREERENVLKRRDHYVECIGDGIPAASVKDALVACQDRLDELDRLIAKEEFKKNQMLDENSVRDLLQRLLKRKNNSRWNHLLIETFIDKLYLNKERVIVLFHLGEEDSEDFTLEELQTLKKDEHPRSEGVRIRVIWWRRGESNSGPYQILHEALQA